MPAAAASVGQVRTYNKNSNYSDNRCAFEGGQGARSQKLHRIIPNSNHEFNGVFQGRENELAIPLSTTTATTVTLGEAGDAVTITLPRVTHVGEFATLKYAAKDDGGFQAEIIVQSIDEAGDCHTFHKAADLAKGTQVSDLEMLHDANPFANELGTQVRYSDIDSYCATVASDESIIHGLTVEEKLAIHYVESTLDNHILNGKNLTLLSPAHLRTYIALIAEVLGELNNNGNNQDPFAVFEALLNGKAAEEAEWMAAAANAGEPVEPPTLSFQKIENELRQLSASDIDQLKNLMRGHCTFAQTDQAFNAKAGFALQVRERCARHARDNIFRNPQSPINEREVYQALISDISSLPEYAQLGGQEAIYIARESIRHVLAHIRPGADGSAQFKAAKKTMELVGVLPYSLIRCRTNAEGKHPIYELLSEIDGQKVIGAGAEAKVRYARNAEGDVVAVRKQTYEDPNHPEYCQEADKLLGMWRDVQSQDANASDFMVPILDTAVIEHPKFQHGRHYIFMPVAKRTGEYELQDIGKMSEDVRPAAIGILGKEMLGTVARMHEAGFCHRDLKPDNFLVFEQEDGTQQVKLGDYGNGCKWGDRHTFTGAGCEPYCPPEALQDEGVYDAEKHDAFSMGRVLLEMKMCSEGSGAFDRRWDDYAEGRSFNIELAIDGFNPSPQVILPPRLDVDGKVIGDLTEGLDADVLQALIEKAEQHPEQINSLDEVIALLLVADPKKRLSPRAALELGYFKQPE